MRIWTCFVLVWLTQVACAATSLDVSVVDAQMARPIEEYRWSYAVDGKWAGSGAAKQWPRLSLEVPCRLNVVADGYLPGAADVTAENAKQWITIELVAQDRIEGVVVDGQGRPVKGARVTFVHRERPAIIRSRTEVDARNAPSILTDDAGWFALPLRGNDWGLLATHESGAGFYLATELPEDVRLTLLPWASCEGVLHEHGQPVKGGIVAIESLVYNLNDYIVIAPAVTGERGQWRIGHLLAKAGPLEEVYYTAGRELRRDPDLIVAQRYEVHASPGKDLRIDMARKGVDVVGRLIIPKERQAEVSWRHSTIGLLVESPRFVPPPEFEKFTDEQKKTFYEQSDRAKYMKAHPQRYQQATLSEDGTFRFIDVPPGQFRFTAVVMPLPPGGEQHRFFDPLAQITQTITVPPEAEGIEDAVFDLGGIQPWVYANLQPGDVAPDVRFRLADGTEQTLKAFRGRHVLVDFWATWCGSCIGEMPTINAVHDQFGRDGQLAVIGLSLDENPEDAWTYAAKEKFTWTQGALGGWHNTPVPSQFGVLGIPTLFLIGPDGKILARDMRGDEIIPTVRKHLTPK